MSILVCNVYVPFPVLETQQFVLPFIEEEPIQLTRKSFTQCPSALLVLELHWGVERWKTANKGVHGQFLQFSCSAMRVMGSALWLNALAIPL